MTESAEYAHRIDIPVGIRPLAGGPSREPSPIEIPPKVTSGGPWGSLYWDEAIIRSWRRRARCHVSLIGELGRMVENRHPFTCTPSSSGDGVHRNALPHFDESARPDRRCRGTADQGHEYCVSPCWSSLARTAHRSDAHNTPRWATMNAYRVELGGICALPRCGHVQYVDVESAGPSNYRLRRTCVARLPDHGYPGGGLTLGGRAHVCRHQVRCAAVRSLPRNCVPS